MGKTISAGNRQSNRFLLTRAVLIATAIILLTGAGCWFLGYRTLPDFGIASVWIAIGMALGGLSSLLGTRGLTHRDEDQQGKTASDMGLDDRNATQTPGTNQSYRFLLEMLLLAAPIFITRIRPQNTD